MCFVDFITFYYPCFDPTAEDLIGLDANHNFLDFDECLYIPI